MTSRRRHPSLPTTDVSDAPSRPVDRADRILTVTTADATDDVESIAPRQMVDLLATLDRLVTTCYRSRDSGLSEDRSGVFGGRSSSHALWCGPRPGNEGLVGAWRGARHAGAMSATAQPAGSAGIGHRRVLPEPGVGDLGQVPRHGSGFDRPNLYLMLNKHLFAMASVDTVRAGLNNGTATDCMGCGAGLPAVDAPAHPCMSIGLPGLSRAERQRRAEV
jgi:hypothetical protein